MRLIKASFSERKVGPSKEKSASVEEMGNLNLDANMGMEKEKVWDASEEIEDYQLATVHNFIFLYE